MRAQLCGIFEPNSGYIAHYAPFIWPKSPTNCDAHLPESNFQTRSSLFERRADFGFHFTQQSSAESIAEVGIVEVIDNEPETVITVAAFRNQADCWDSFKKRLSVSLPATGSS